MSGGGGYMPRGGYVLEIDIISILGSECYQDFGFMTTFQICKIYPKHIMIQ